ncbi:MAG TPA: CRTAC1 family protein [Acidobacteriota bacterium]|nr:CRTAC1 family protein [Acidobacteriota bacterium]
MKRSSLSGDAAATARTKRAFCRLLASSFCHLALLALFASSLPASSPTSSSLGFRDVADKAGLDFVLENFCSPRKYMIEPMTGGIAVFDYDNDGLLDVFFANGAVIPSLKKEEPKYFNRLYRNQGDMKFKDVTTEAGLRGEGYSMGVAAADYDNDGDIDLFVAGVFRNLLYRNTGKGHFEEVTEQAGIKSDLWSVAAGWFDYDRDGFLDLFVANYVEWDPETEPFCGDRARNIRVYCHPKYYKGVKNQLYKNRGDGTFEDVTEVSGIGEHAGRGMSVAFEDYDRDGYLDVFVTNDNHPNFLFRNRGDGTFEEVGLLSGSALREHGKPIASMGVDFRDYDNDALPDLVVTALAGETFPVFRNSGQGWFEDKTQATQIGALSIRFSAWGNGLFDFNNDGWKDLFTANSHVNDRIELFEAREYKQRNSLFLNSKNGTFQDVSEALGPGFQKPRAHRGIGFGDFNLDGRMDVVVTSIEDKTELWENTGANGNNWIILRLVGTKSNRDGIGAQVRIGRQYNMMTTAVGYASSSHSGVHFGLGDVNRVEKIEILWPSGTRQTLNDVAVNQVLEVVEPSSGR